ncbi:MAG: helix-turn-helix transcriptional regulator [Ignavibacteria bacterium]|nr:helix-turn-helix transcriptional regulator [Ignavibacteria bacterium]
MGIRERKEREKEQRRIDILDSARQAFLKHGLEQTSMDRIAQEAELAKGTLVSLLQESRRTLDGLDRR